MWASGEEVRVEPNEREGFPFELRNVHSPNATVTVRAKQIEEWPALTRDS